MTIKGSFILEHPHVKAIFGRKTKNRFQKWWFFGNLRVYILIVVIGTRTPKKHILGRNDVVGVFCVKIRSDV